MTANPQHNPELVPTEQVYPRAKYLPLEANNYQLDVTTFHCKHPILTEILLGHPLWPLFNETASVPEVYLQQFWGTVSLNTEVNPHRFQAQIANTTVSFSCTRLRKILKLPAADSVQGRQTFESRLSEKNVCQDIKRLGYFGDLLKVPDFKRGNLAQPWLTLFTIVNKCLSGKHSGHDRCSTNFMDVFHGIVFNHHYNFAAIFWKEFTDLVSHKTAKKRTFLPYWRFMSILVQYFLNKHPEIPIRPDSELKTPKTMVYVQKEVPLPDVQAMVIPEYLLMMANQNAPAVKNYRKLHNLSPMVQPQPVDPTQGGSLVRSDGSVIEGEQGGVGDSEHEGDFSDASASVGGNDDQGDDDDDQVNDADQDDQGNTPAVQKKRRIKDLFDSNALEVLARIARDKKLAEGKEKEKEKAAEKQKEKAAQKQNMKKKKYKAKKPKSSAKKVTSSDIHDISDEVDAVFEILVAERDEGVDQATNISQTSPTVHESTLPIHSAVSEQTVVSSQHGNQPHNLLVPQSKATNIERNEPSLLLTSHPLITQRLESFEPIFSDSIRTHYESNAHLHDVAGTSVEASPSDQPRGSEEHPVTVNIMLDVNTGRPVEQVSSVVSTGSLSGLGVTPFITGQEQLLREVPSTVKFSMTDKGKAPMPETPLPRSPPHQRQINLPPPVSRPSTQTIDELKSLLLAQLLNANLSGDNKGSFDLKDHSSANPGLSDSQFKALNQKMDAQHAQLLAQIAEINKTQSAKLAEFSANQTALSNTVQQLCREVRSLRDLCTVQASGLKRKHDDSYDSDHHEGGEKTKSFSYTSHRTNGFASETPKASQPEPTQPS